MTVQEVRVQRVSIFTSVSFDTVLARIDAAIGHPDMVAFRKSFSSAQNLSEMEKVVNPVTQPNGLMEFTRFDLGEVLRKESGGKGSRILRVVAGNPLIMKEMVKQVVDAGSYAPVTILIEERADNVRISYDRMASYLAPYANSDAFKVARALDEKLERILTEAASITEGCSQTACVNHPLDLFLNSTSTVRSRCRFKVFAFLTKREGFGMKEFIYYYEGKHIPLILSLAPGPLIYKRRYLVRDQELTKSGNLVDYDVMTELGFADQEEFASWMGKLSAPGIAEQVAEDEERSLNRSRTRAYVVQEYATAVSEERA